MTPFDRILPCKWGALFYVLGKGLFTLASVFTVVLADQG